MRADATLDELVESVADGESIDWAKLEAGADADVLRLLAHFQTVATVAKVHRAPMDDDRGPGMVSADEHLPGPLGELGEIGRWGHLQLVRKLGEGSYGEVFHARDTWLDHPVALKLLRPDLSDRVLPTKLLDEARVLVKVRHPNVVAVHGADLQQGRVGFWMEFVQGQRLDDLVAFQGLLSAEDAAEIGQGLCSALSAVHDAGLVHRDVKAQNVIREPKGRVVLMDFGAGHLIADGAQGGGAGTPLYLAPEMFNNGHASPQTDVYALGVLLYYLVTASYPVPARSIEELKDAHARGRQRPLHLARTGLPRSFTNVIDKMVAIDPADRYATAADALAGLKAFTAPASMVRKLVAWTGRLVAIAIAITGLGLLNTATFNLLLGRSTAFHHELGIATWFRWGLSSLLAPATYISVLILALTVLAGIGRVLRRLSPPLDRAATATRTRIIVWAAERGLDEPSLLLQATVALGAVLLAALFWGFWDYGAGFLAAPLFVNDAPLDRLAALRPSQETRVDVYGWLLDILILTYGLVLYRIVSWAQRINVRLLRATRIAALLVPILALFLWQLPYRLFYQSAFERVDLAAARCYQLGSGSGNVLLHCPDMEPPRNRIVRATDPTLHRRGVVESIFLPVESSRPTR